MYRRLLAWSCRRQGAWSRVASGLLVVAVAGTADVSIVEHLSAALKSVRMAQDSLLQGDAAGCNDAVRSAKQSMKAVVGRASDLPERQDHLGKPMQESLRALRDAKALCDPENQGRGVAALGRVADLLQEYQPVQHGWPRSP